MQVSYFKATPPKRLTYFERSYDQSTTASAYANNSAVISMDDGDSIADWNEDSRVQSFLLARPQPYKCLKNKFNGTWNQRIKLQKSYDLAFKKW